MRPGNYVDLLMVNNKWILEKWTLTLPASALVLWRRYSLGLRKAYRFFFAYLAVALIRTSLLLPFSPQSRPYYDIWAATQPLVCDFQSSRLFSTSALPAKKAAAWEAPSSLAGSKSQIVQSGVSRWPS